MSVEGGNEMPIPIIDDSESLLCFRHARQHYMKRGTEKIETGIECFIESFKQESCKRQLTTMFFIHATGLTYLCRACCSDLGSTECNV